MKPSYLFFYAEVFELVIPSSGQISQKLIPIYSFYLEEQELLHQKGSGVKMKTSATTQKKNLDYQRIINATLQCTPIISGKHFEYSRYRKKKICTESNLNSHLTVITQSLEANTCTHLFIFLGNFVFTMSGLHERINPK